MTPLERLRLVAQWGQPWRKQAGNAIAKGFRDAICGLPCTPPYRTIGMNLDYRAGWDLGASWVDGGEAA